MSSSIEDTSTERTREHSAHDHQDTSPASTSEFAITGSTSPSPSGSIPSVEQQTTTPANAARDHRVASLKSQVTNLEKQLEEVLAKQEAVNAKLKNPTNPGKTVKRHINLLHEFNEIRDVAQGLIGLIAESRGERVQSVYPEFGLDTDD